MNKIITFHSFRRGTGKTSLVANIATLLALEGRRVAIMDTDIQSPGMHVLFNLEEQATPITLLDYLWGRCDIEQAVYDMAANLGESLKRPLYLVPTSTDPLKIAQELRANHDFARINQACHDLTTSLNLDVLLVDTHAGLYEETLLSIANSDVLALVLRIDKQDHQGTAVVVEVARRLGVPRIVILANEIPQSFDRKAVKAQLEEVYGCEVAGILPYTDALAALASSAIFVLKHPDHTLTRLLKQIATALTA
jgi:MinD-like ATPase involved in chromosome partitioning or flagellar assembly